MKELSRKLLPMLVFSVLLVSACAGASPAAGIQAANKVAAAPVQFTGPIEAMDGNQWIVGGQTITVDASILRDGPFAIGDVVNVEATTAADGSLLVTRMELPVAGSANVIPQESSTPNPAPASAGLVFDEGRNEAFGTIDEITVDGIVIGGQSFAISNGAEIKDQIQPGDFVRVHFSLNADGTMSITEIEISDPTLVNADDSNSGDDQSLDDDDEQDSADDHGNDADDDQNDDDSDSGGDNSGSSGHD